MWDKLQSGMTSGSGLGALLGMASAIGLPLSPGLELLVSAMKRAPAPTQTTLGGDWLKNLDVISHSVGCIIAGAFDDIADDLSREELEAISATEFSEVLPPGLARTLLDSSFRTCREFYLKKGPLVPQIESGSLKPEGLATKSIMRPLVEKGGEAKVEKGKKIDRFLKRGAKPKVVSLEEGRSHQVV
jgi:hypothetical protein